MGPSVYSPPHQRRRSLLQQFKLPHRFACPFIRRSYCTATKWPSISRSLSRSHVIYATWMLRSLLSDSPNLKSFTPTLWLGEMGIQSSTNIRDFRAKPHYRAAWHGSRIIMRQVSPESQSIFDFILETYRACGGNWESLAEQVGVSSEVMEGFLEYASVFLGNIGNYYVRVGRFILGGRRTYGGAGKRRPEVRASNFARRT